MSEDQVVPMGIPLGVGPIEKKLEKLEKRVGKLEVVGELESDVERNVKCHEGRIVPLEEQYWIHETDLDRIKQDLNVFKGITAVCVGSFLIVACIKVSISIYSKVFE